MSEGLELIHARAVAYSAEDHVDAEGHHIEVGDHVHGKDIEGHDVKGVVKSIDDAHHEVIVLDEHNAEHHCHAKDLHDDDSHA